MREFSAVYMEGEESMKRYGTVPRFEGRICENRVVWETEGELVYMEPYGTNGVRFRSSASLHIDTELNWTLLKPELGADVKVMVEKDRRAFGRRNGDI